ncbi:unnamed protein product [Dicrocoelium dendriticum]|nr:unnamed protein product [Dicrocoelium dendriticum]
MTSPISILSDREDLLDDITSSQAEVCSRQNAQHRTISPTDSAGERISVSSSPSSLTHVDLPEVIPDDLDVPDLASYIQKAVERVQGKPRSIEEIASELDPAEGTKLRLYQLSGEDPPSLKENDKSHVGHLYADCFSISSHPWPTVNGLNENIPRPVSVTHLVSGEEGAVNDSIKDPTQFASFASFTEPTVLCSDTWTTTDKANSEMDQTAFRQCAGYDTDEFGDDDFGEFTCLTTQLNTDVSQKADEAIGTAEILQRLLSHLEPVLRRTLQLNGDSLLNDWISAVPTNSHYSTAGFQPIGDCTVSYSSGTGLWNKLLPPNRLHDFRYRWNKSSIYEACLQSIHVDMRHAMPPFANHLRLLEPVKLNPQKPPDSVLAVTSATHDVGSLSVTPNGGTLTPDLSLNPQPNYATTIVDKPNGDLHLLSDTADSTGQLDLGDFDIRPSLSVRTTTDSTRSRLLELEREIFAEVAPLPVQSLPPQLSTDVSYNSTPERSVHSSNVRTTLCKLPKLAYMRAKCLMFPLADIRST